MATRFWLTNAAAPYTPATRRGAWDVASGEDVQLLGRRPQGSAGTSSINAGSTAADRDVLLHRSISAAAVKAGTISGTVSWTIGVRESNADLNGVFHLHMYVTSGDSDTPRGTLLADYIGASEFTTTATGTQVLSQAVSSVAIQAGDRLVVEIGYRATSLATTYNATINYGNTGGTDLSSGSTAVTSEPGWIELSGADGLFTNAFATLTDTFTSSIDSKWTKTTNVTATGGRARIPTTTTLESMYTTGAYELQGSAVAFQVPAVPATGGGTGAVVAAYIGAGPTITSTNLEILYTPNNGNLQFRNNVGGSDAGAVNITYNATDHAWWRIREASGQIFMETSPDNATWTTRRTISSISQWMRLGTLILYLESQRTSGTADFTEFDNINVSSGTTTALSGAASSEAARPLTGAKAGTLGVAASTGTARPLTGGKQYSLGVALATAVAQPITGAKTATLGPGSAAGAAQALPGTKQATANPAATVETGQSLTRAKHTALTPAAGTTTAQALTGTITHPLTTATTLTAAQALAGSRSAQLGTASSTTQALPLTGTKTRTLTPAAATETAHPLTTDQDQPTLGLTLTGLRTPWRTQGAHTAWACTGRTTTMDALSTEYLEVGVTWDHGDPTTSTVQMAVIPVGHTPDDTDWHDADWSTDSDGLDVTRLLVGPDGGALSPTPGRYRAWVSVDAPPEHPVLYTSPFDIT